MRYSFSEILLNKKHSSLLRRKSVCLLDVEIHHRNGCISPFEVLWVYIRSRVKSSRFDLLLVYLRHGSGMEPQIRKNITSPFR